jgi:AcrR family transcriptional regulator
MAGKPISEQTRAHILATAWDLIARSGRADVGQAEIAAAAGVSRQTVFYAFGSRAGLLTAMVAFQDDRSERLRRLSEVSTRRDTSVGALVETVEAWLDYLPEVYPVAALLDAASLTDAEAKAAIESRMVGRLLAGLQRRLAAMAAARTLAAGRDPVRTAEAIWELVHLPAWRLLVVDRGWTPEAFRDNRIALVRALVT